PAVADAKKPTRGDDDERRSAAERPRGEREAQDAPRWAPGANARAPEDRRLQHDRGQEQRREDRREGPVVTHATQERIRLEAVIAPPEPKRVLAPPPEARGVVELEEPPARDGRERDQNALDPVGGEIGPAAEARRQGVDEQHVAGPDDRREPPGHRRLTREKEHFGGTDDREPDPPVCLHVNSADYRVAWRGAGASASRR